jgi:hypothetical protein
MEKGIIKRERRIFLEDAFLHYKIQKFQILMSRQF